MLLRVTVLFVSLVYNCAACGVGQFSEIDDNACKNCPAGKFTGDIPAMIEASKMAACPVATPACGVFVSSNYRMCACSGSHALLSFLQLGESVDTLQTWADAGIVDFNMFEHNAGGTWFDCNEVCGRSSLTCNNTGYPTTQRGDALFRYQDMECLKFRGPPEFSSDSPYFNTGDLLAPCENYDYCYAGVEAKTTCEAKARWFTRICACSGAPKPLVSRGVLVSNDVYTGASGASSCINCTRGSFSNEGSSICTPCEAGKYASDAVAAERCNICPADSNSVISSSHISECICITGVLSDINGVWQCVSCPDNSVVSGLRCECIAGWTWSDTICTACVAGTYKIALGTAACTDCLAGQYSAEVGAASDVCQTCPTHSDAPAASNSLTACVCNTGSTGPDGGQCAVCPTHSDSLGGDASCTCNIGSTGPDGGPCVLCAAGRYKAVSGNIDCVDCVVGKISGSIKTAIDTSVMQEWGTAGINRWIRGSNGESCDAVCTSANMTCMRGESFPQKLSYTATYALFAQTQTNCSFKYPSTDASAPYFSGGNRCYISTGVSRCGASSASFARLCPCGSHPLSPLLGSIATSTLQTWAAAGVRDWKLGGDGQSCDTTCVNIGLTCSTASGRFPQQLTQTNTDAAFAHAGVYCQYKHDMDYHAAAPFYSYFTRTGSRRCYKGSGTGNTAPNCASWHTGWQRLCSCSGTAIAISRDFVVSDGLFIGASACSDCVAGKYTTTTSSTCLDCVAGTYKTLAGPDACTDCGISTYSASVGATHSSTCLACPLYADAPMGSNISTACVCKAGSSGPADMCVLCAAGKYKALAGPETCADCGIGTYSVSVGANQSSTCLTCPLNADAPVGSNISTACTCNAGAYGIDGGTCVQCAAGTYTTLTGPEKSIVVDTTNLSACSACPIHSNSIPGSSVYTACTCNAGYTGPNGGPCNTCPINSNSPGGNTTCTCNIGASGLDGENCSLCYTGTYKTTSGDALCTNCTAGTYSAIIGAASSVVCQNCPANSDAPPASIKCTCNAGFWGVATTGCTPCAAGTYGVGRDMTTNACLSCQNDSHSPAGSASAADCTCNAGASGLDGEKCSLCYAGTYKTTSGDALCANCTAGTYSAMIGAASSGVCQTCPANSDAPPASTSCTCNAGFWGMVTAKCNACAAGTYGVDRNMTTNACLSCRRDSHSPAGSASAADCRCNAGYSLMDKNCSVCRAGTYSTAGSVCVECQAGKYSDALAAYRCMDCPNNHFRLEPGATRCTPCSAGKISIPGFTACRVPAVCPGWSDSMVDAAAAELMIPNGDMTDEEKLASSDVLELFVAHYARHSKGQSPPDCVDMYERTIERMRSNRLPSSAEALVSVVNCWTLIVYIAVIAVI